MSLASKIFLNTLFVLAVLFGITGWLSVRDERAALEEMGNKQASLLAHSLAAFSVETLVAEDYPSLDKALQTILAYSGDSIVHVRISHNGRTLASYGQPELGRVFSAPVVLNQPESTQHIGDVHLTLSHKDGDRLIAARQQELVVSSLMLFVTLAFALHTLIHRLVLRRLAALTARTEGVIAECVPDQALEAPDRTTGDEIDLLHQRYEALLSGLTWRDHQRSLAMSELQAAQSLLDDVANALPSALIVLDTNETIAYSNRSARALAAQTGDLTGQPLLAAYPLLEDNQDTIRAVVSSNKPQDVHRRIWQRDKQQMILNLSIYPLSQSAVGGVVIRIDDVTERTRFEEAMIQTEKLSSIGGLAAGVAHEINNPLGVMVQAAQNIERRLSDSLEANHRIAAELGIELATIRNYLEKRSILAFLDDIKADGARAAKIVRNLLEFSRKSEPTRQETALPDLIDCALELARKDYDLKKRFDFRKIEIVLHHDPDLPAIRLIRSEVEQVLLNLLKNAAQAMSAVPEQTGSDGPRITITTRMLAAWAEIEIQDNGPGFSIESRKRAFEPFYTTKAPGEGTGLGLWVSYMIMTDKHQGQMLLESSPGQGACFRLRFPL